MQRQRSSASLETITTSDPAGTAERLIGDALCTAVEERGRCLVALSGGRTPLALYRLLARRKELPWARVELFWGDERFVPHGHPDSNAGAAQDALIDLLPIPEGQVHRWPILANPQASAAAYEKVLKSAAGEEPLFDINLLGLGTDCHTASLFPEAEALRSRGLTVATRAPDGQARLSLTVPALSRSRLVVFLVTGEEKRAALLQLLDRDGDSRLCPARAISALERLVVVTDLDTSA